MDFDKKESYLQLYVVDKNEPGTSLDLADRTLKNFVSEGKSLGLQLIYNQDIDHHLNQPQIRLGMPKTTITETSQIFRDWLDQQEIIFSVKPSELIIENFVNEFNLGVKWGEYKSNLSNK